MVLNKQNFSPQMQKKSASFLQETLTSFPTERRYYNAKLAIPCLVHATYLDFATPGKSPVNHSDSHTPLYLALGLFHQET